MTYAIIYNGEYGKDSIVLNPKIGRKTVEKNEFYGYINIKILEPEYKLVSCIPKEMDCKSKSITHADIEHYVNKVYKEKEDDFDIIYDLLSKILDRDIYKEKILFKSISF